MAICTTVAVDVDTVVVTGLTVEANVLVVFTVIVVSAVCTDVVVMVVVIELVTVLVGVEAVRSKRSVTYLVYKLPFTGLPTERPKLHAAAYRAGESALTSYFVSWNGATSVAKWRFWRARVDKDHDHVLIGETLCRGFETTFQSEGCEIGVFAEALDHEGRSLGATEIVAVLPPAVAVHSIAADHKHLNEVAEESLGHDEL